MLKLTPLSWLHQSDPGYSHNMILLKLPLLAACSSLVVVKGACCVQVNWWREGGRKGGEG